MKKVQCEICGEYVPQSDMSKSYRHRCKKCVAELTRQSRHDAKMRLAATEESDTHTADPATPYGCPVSDILQQICTNGTDETIRFAIQTYGKDAQTLMLFEEMAELQDAICKHSRGRDKNHPCLRGDCRCHDYVLTDGANLWCEMRWAMVGFQDEPFE